MSALAIPGRRGESGVTLVEILVSLSIIGAVASVAMLSVRPGGGGGGSVEIEARRLAGLLDLAANEALTTGGRVIFGWDADGYEFRATGMDVPGLAGRKTFGRGVAMQGEGAEPQHAIGRAFDDPFMLILGAGSVRWQVEFDGLSARAVRAPS